MHSTRPLLLVAGAGNRPWLSIGLMVFYQRADQMIVLQQCTSLRAHRHFSASDDEPKKKDLYSSPSWKNSRKGPWQMPNISKETGRTTSSQPSPHESPPTSHTSSSSSSALSDRIRAIWRTVAPMIQQSTEKVVHKAERALRQSAWQSRDWTRGQVRRARDHLQWQWQQRTQQLRTATVTRVRTAASRIQLSLTTWLSSSVHRTYDAVTRPVRDVAQKLVPSIGWDSLSSTAARWWNRFWWWSLAAIGVYGVATTVPKEVIRQKMASIQQHRDHSTVEQNTTTTSITPEKQN